MSLLNQPYLGHITDPLDSEVPQDELNGELLAEFDAIELLRSIHMRISEPMIKYLLDHIDKNDIGFFTQLLNTIAKVYSLNYLKLYKERFIEKNDYVKSIIYITIFIKIKLINLIETKRIEKDISREELEKFLIIEDAPSLLIECIKYIDAESYKKFINRIFIEEKLGFIE